MLNGNENKQILLYCTGGIRCEKASAYLIQNGFKDVNQLQGGIIQYAHDVKEKGLQSKFRGKNFVFDQRLGERVTDDILSFVIFVDYLAIVIQIVKMMLVISYSYSVKIVEKNLMDVVQKNVKVLPNYLSKNKRFYVRTPKE